MCDGKTATGQPRKLSSLALAAMISQLEVQEDGEDLIRNTEQTEKAVAKILVPLLSELQAAKLQLRSEQSMKK